MAVSEDSDIKQENAHLKEIEELIFDQDLILTYKKLSKLLNVHVNTAKRLLRLFVENSSKGKRPVSASYLVSGKELDGGAWRVCVVAEDQLDVTKKSFSPDCLSDHVYSVHQGGKVLDTGALISANKSDESTSRFSAIKNKNATPRELDVMQQLAKKAALAAAAVAPPVVNKSKTEPVKKEAESKKSDPVKKEAESKKSDPVKKEAESKADVKQGSTISGMFAAQNSKSADTNNKPAPKPAAAPSAKGGKKAKTTGNIASFFQRQKDAPKKSVVTTTSTDTSPVNSQAESEASSPVEVPASKQVVSPKVNGNAKKVSSKTSTKRKSKSKSEAPKKRKRIMAQSDSESSDNESDVEVMEDDAPPPPVSHVLESDDDEEVIASTTNSVIKEKKLVDKVYKDEKGFIVTKKEWVVETRTEEVEVTEVKKSPKKEAEAPVKRKQQSDIMSFFGRK